MTSANYFEISKTLSFISGHTIQISRSKKHTSYYKDI